MKKQLMVIVAIASIFFYGESMLSKMSEFSIGTKDFVNKSNSDVYVVLSPKQKTLCSLNLVTLVPQGQTREISYHGSGDHPALERVVIHDAEGKAVAAVTDDRGLNTHKIITYTGSKNVGLSNPPLTAEQLKAELKKVKEQLREERMHIRPQVEVKMESK